MPIDTTEELQGRVADLPYFRGAAMSERMGGLPEAPSLPTDRLGAFMRRDSVFFAYAEAEAARPQNFDPVEGYNPFADNGIAGYEMYWRHFTDARSPQHTSAIKAQIDKELDDQKLMAEAGLGESLLWSMVAGTANPTTLLPIGYVGTAGRMAFNLGKARHIRGMIGGAAAATSAVAIEEAQLHELQITRTASETAANLTGATVVGGLLGEGAQLLGDAMARALGKAVELEVRARGVQEAVVDKVGGYEKLSKLSPAEVRGEFIEAAKEADPELAKILTSKNGFLANLFQKGLSFNPGSRLAFSDDSVTARLLGMKMTDQPWRRVNLPEGVNSENVEVAIETWMMEAAVVDTDIQRIFDDYKKSGGKLNRTEFNKAVGIANQRSEKADFLPEGEREHVERAAGLSRIFFDRVTKTSQELGFIDDVDLRGTAMSWLHRRYDQDAITARRGELHQLIVDHLSSKPEEDLLPWQGDVGAAADDVIMRMQGGKQAREGLAGSEVVGETAAFQDRTLLIPDHVIQDFLITDIREVLASVAQRVIPDLELSRAFSTSSKAVRRLHQEWRAVRKKYNEGEAGFAELNAYARYTNDVDAAAVLRSSATKAGDEAADELEAMAADVYKLNTELAELRREIAGAAGSKKKKQRMKARIADIVDELDDEVRDKIMEGHRQAALKTQGLRGEKATVKLMNEEANADHRFVDPIDMNADFISESQIRSAMDRMGYRTSEVRSREAQRGVTLGQWIDKVRSDFAEKKKRAKTVKERKRLQKREERTIADIQTIRDRLRNVAGLPDDPTHWAFFAERTLRRVNFLRFMGGVLISAFPDLAMGVLTQGFSRWGKVVRLRLLNSTMKGRWLQEIGAKEEIAKFVACLELTSSANRIRNLGDVADMTTMRGPVDKGLDWMSEKFATMTGMNRWNANMKAMASLGSADGLISIGEKLAAGKKLSRSEVNSLEALGVARDDAIGFYKQWKKHGQTDGGLKLSRSQEWEDQGLRRRFQQAVIRDVRRTIITPSAGDLPTFMSQPWVRLLGQFRSFGMAATTKIVGSNLQRGDARTVQGLFALFTMGAMTYVLKDTLAGREISDDPVVFAVNAIDRSGMVGILTDVAQFAGSSTKLATGWSPFGERLSRFQDRNLVDAILGPSFGTVEDVRRIGQHFLEGGGLTQSQVHRLRRLVPFQNLFYLRAIFDEIEARLGETLNPGELQ